MTRPSSELSLSDLPLSLPLSDELSPSPESALLSETLAALRRRRRSPLAHEQLQFRLELRDRIALARPARALAAALVARQAQLPPPPLNQPAPQPAAQPALAQPAQLAQHQHQQMSLPLE